MAEARLTLAAALILLAGCSNSSNGGGSPVPDSMASQVVALPSGTRIADGLDQVTIQVTVEDSHGQPLSGHIVQIASTGGGNTIVQPGGPTDAAGQAAATLTSITAGSKTFTATIDPGGAQVVLAQHPVVDFVGDPSTIDPTISTAAANPPSGVVADGSQGSTITVTVRDVHGNGVAGQMVQLAATGSNNSLTQPSAVTDTNGVASGMLASTTAETKTISATINPGASQVLVIQQPTVAFVGDPGTIDPTTSTSVASPENDVVADGTTTSTITVTVKDFYGNAVSGQTVGLAATGANNSLTQPAAVTDANGVATGTLSSTTAETKTVTATINPGASQVQVIQQPTVAFVGDPGTISAANSTATASPSSNVVANGTTSSTVTVTVKDAHDNAVVGQTVLLVASGSNNTLTQPTAVTDASGVATGTLSSTTAETKTVTATINPGASQIVVAQAPTVDFIADASTIDASLSSAEANPSGPVLADGVAFSTITVTVKDAHGNAVPGQIVLLAASGSNNTLTQPPAVTDANGVAAGTIASTTAETKTLTATINPGANQVVVAQQPTVVFVGNGGSVSSTLSTVSASPSTGVVADGVQVSTITVTVKDNNGNPVAGQTVQLVSSGSNNALTQPPAVTDASGVAAGTIASITAETKTLTATINPGGSQVVVAQQPTVGFVGDPSTISAANSTATASPSSNVVADGTTASTIMVAVKDAHGNGVAGQSVQLAASGSNNTLTQPPAITDANGVAAGTIASTTAETKTVTATINPGAGQVVVAQQPVVGFVGDPSTISAVNSTATASPSSNVVADGTTTSTVTVTVKDAHGNAVAGQTVLLSSTGSNNTLTQPPAVTDASGMAAGTIASITAETKSLTATINPGGSQVVVAQQPTVGFVGDPTTISAANSTATANPSSNVVADGTTSSAVTVTVKDAHGNAVAGQTVLLSSTGSNNTLTQPPAVTDASGMATGTIASITAETKTLTATINPGGSQVVVAQQPTVGFVGDPTTINAANSTATANPSSNVVADGTTTSAVTVTVKDAHGNGVAGQSVQLAASGSNNTLTQPPAVTDASGVAAGTIASTTAETKTLTATINPGGSQVVVAQQPTADFVADPSTISATNSTATASPSTSVVANGIATSTITVTVKDANGNAVSGQSVQLAASGSNNTLTQPSAVTDASGVAIGTIASTNAETKTLTATINPGASQVVVTQQPTVGFVGDPATISAANSSLSANPSTSMIANGLDTSVITVTVRDANANPVAGQTVTIASTGSGNTVTQPASATDAAGMAIGGIASTAAETKTVSATINPGPGQVDVTQTATVQFVWSPANTYFVRQTGTDPGGCTGGTTPSTAWRTIGQAASCAGPGSVIYVGAGTYNESVTLTTSGTSAYPIRFLADSTGVFTGDAGEVVVDGGGANETLWIDGASWVDIGGFTIRGGTSGSAPSGGIRLGDTACSNITLHDNVIYGNAEGIYVRSANRVTIEHNSISSNANSIGDGIVVRASSGVTVRDNLIYGNGRYGVFAEEGSLALTIEANTFYENANDQVGIDNSGNDATISNNIIAFGSQHGITLAAGSTATSSYNDLWSNSTGNWNGLAPGTGDFSLDPFLVDPDGADNILGGANCVDDDFHLSTSPASPALDAGSANAAALALSDGFTLADLTSRLDLVLDGTAPDGPILNLGYHYSVGGAVPAPLDVGDARLYYGEGSVRQVRMRTFDASLPSWGAEVSAPPSDSTVHFVVSQTSPLTNGEEILASLADTGTSTRLDLLDWSGASWSRVFQSTAITSANSGRRGYDVAFESLSGDLLVVYSNNTATPVYRARSAGTWSSETSLPLNDGGGPNPDPNSGIVHWIELVPRPGTNEIALGYSDANRDLVVIVWDGTQWLTATAVRVDNNLTPYGSTSAVENRAFDLAYEGLTGNLVAAYARSSTNGFRYAVKPATSSTFGPRTNVIGAPGSAANFVALAAEPGTNRIAAAAARITGGARPERLGLATWTGSAWVNSGEYDFSTTDLANTGRGDYPVDVAWVGTSGVAVCVYPDSTTATLDWVRWNSGGGWVVQTDMAMAGKSYSDSVQLLYNSAMNRVLLILSDASSALYAGTYDGTIWSLTGTALETSLSSIDARAFGAALKNP